jgi:hypothetical protein
LGDQVLVLSTEMTGCGAPSHRARRRRATFLLVALLRNSERRNDLALHYKLDAIACALADLM